MNVDSLTGRFKVLIVDDELGARDLLLEYFQSLGFDTASASDGRQAMALLQASNGCFGLVVTDLSLPGADGFAVLHAARHANPQAYVVIVTGYASLDSAIKAVRTGAYDYLTKPFSLSQVEVLLARIQDRVQLEDASRRLRFERPVADYPGRPTSDGVERRLAAIEASLTRIEQTLGRGEV